MGLVSSRRNVLPAVAVIAILIALSLRSTSRDDPQRIPLDLDKSESRESTQMAIKETIRGNTFRAATQSPPAAQMKHERVVEAAGAWPFDFPPITSMDTMEMRHRLRNYLSPAFVLNSNLQSPPPSASDAAALSPVHRHLANVSKPPPSSGVEVEFLVCVRPWLYEFLAPRFPHLVSDAPHSLLAAKQSNMTRSNATPPVMRAKMGEVRTWSSLLGALSDRLGCGVRLSQQCHELPHWNHDVVSADAADNDHGQSTPTPPVVRKLRVFLTEDLSLDWLRGKNTKNNSSVITGNPTMGNANNAAAKASYATCIQRARQTIAIAGQSSKFFPNERVLPLFHIAEHNRSLGMVAECPGQRNGVLYNASSGVPIGPEKRWFAVLWGKTGQVGPRLHNAIHAVRQLIPVVSSCVGGREHCDPALPTLNVAPSANVTATFAAAVRSAVLLVGIRAPERGAACPEALACGTYIVARGRNLGFEFAGHPMVRRFRKHVDFSQHLKDILVHHWGFQQGVPFDRQPRAPDRARAWAVLSRGSHEGRPLPYRYSSEGYVQHIADLFGILPDRALQERGTPHSCKALIPPDSFTLDHDGGVSTNGKGNSILQIAFSPHWKSWRWSGC